MELGQNLTTMDFVAPVPREKLPLPLIIWNWLALVPVRDTVPVAVPPPVFFKVKE